MPRQSARNHRSNPYVLDELMLSAHHSAIGVLWRFRTELLLLASIATSVGALSQAVSVATTAAVVATIISIVMAVPWTRRWVIRRAWCVLCRHRIHRVCYETRMHTRSGRLPLILRIHPTRVGERALIWCRAGICAEDFEAHTGEIAAACYAREVRVERSAARAQIVRVDIVRRDTLHPGHVVTSGLAPNPAHRAASESSAA